MCDLWSPLHYVIKLQFFTADFVMTIMIWIRVHPYKATHFENGKSILHFIAFVGGEVYKNSPDVAGSTHPKSQISG